jgi:hypothetical protein
MAGIFAQRVSWLYDVARKAHQLLVKRKQAEIISPSTSFFQILKHHHQMDGKEHIHTHAWVYLCISQCMGYFHVFHKLNIKAVNYFIYMNMFHISL